MVREVIYEHLICDSFARGYTIWLQHGKVASINASTFNSHEQDESYEVDEINEMLHDAFSMLNSESNVDDPSHK